MLQSLRNILTCLSAIVLALTLSLSGANAQVAAPSPSAKFKLFEIGGAIVGDRLNIDEAFSLRHKIPVPAAFSVLVPRENDVLRLAENAPDGPTGPFLRLSFTSEDRQLIENILLAPMTIDLETTPEARLEALAGILSGQFYATAVKNALQHSRDLVRKTIIGGLPAVEVVGRYEDPQLGLMYLRIVGIPNPNRKEGLFVVAKVVASQLELQTPNDFARTRGGVMLREFKFLR